MKRTIAYAYHRHGAPTPAGVLRVPLVVGAMAAPWAIAIAAVFATGPVSHYARGSIELAIAGYLAWLYAGIVTSCLLPVFIGGLMLRFLRSGTLVSLRDG